MSAQVRLARGRCGLSSTGHERLARGQDGAGNAGHDTFAAGQLTETAFGPAFNNAATSSGPFGAQLGKVWPRSNWRSAVLARIATITVPSCLSASRGNIDAATSFEPKPLLERGMTAVTMIREGTSRSHSPNQKVIHAHALPTQNTVIILLELHVKTENGSNTERAKSSISEP